MTNCRCDPFTGDECQACKNKLLVDKEEYERLKRLEAALPKTADGVPIVPSMTIYDRWLPEGWLVTGFDTTDGRLTCLYTKQGFDAICSGYYSTREAAEAAREAEKARRQ